MLQGILDNLLTLGPLFAGLWAITILLTVFRPQRYLNSLLLMAALLVTVVFVSGFFSPDVRGTILLVFFLLTALALFLVPLFLIINGIQMLRRESVCPAHLLSLGLGIAVGIGEIASAAYVLGTAGMLPIGRWNLWMLMLAVTVFYFSFLVLSFVVYSVFMQILPRRMDFDFVIIHGCGLSGGDHMTKLLSNRVDKAIEIYKKCGKKPFLIPSGGQGADEKISEAKAMADYLVSHGIPEARILPEDRSGTTEENLKNSKAIIDTRPGSKKTALVSSNYHVYRCLRLARKLHLPCTGIGADVALYFWPSALIREFIAVFVTKEFFPWAILGYVLFSVLAVYAFTI
ncbi:MAG: YdcF family protein [Clostridia bacterium]|nr:YdcF family protein [Clostridia bacterium]